MSKYILNDINASYKKVERNETSMKNNTNFKGNEEKEFESSSSPKPFVAIKREYTLVTKSMLSIRHAKKNNVCTNHNICNNRNNAS